MKNLKPAAPVTAAIPAPPNPWSAVREDLRAVEEKLSRLLDSNEPLISEICHYLVDGGGKRLRPLFILLAYRACGGGDAKVEDAIDAAIALELIHSATLLHDDIIDGGQLRRGKPSALARYGHAASLVAGDFLFCRAFELCGRFEERLVHTAARACIQLTEGEVMEGRMRRNPAASLDDYTAVITRKTASLFSAGGRVAADLAQAAPRTIEAMEQLGLALGLAFQMVDDLLDILGPEEKIGKPVGSDLRAGIISLPVVMSIQANPELRRLFCSKLEGANLERALELMREPSLIARGRALAAAQIERARAILARELEPSIYSDCLASLIDDQIDRDL
ncbi:MAG TPA: polyprenyl synthetase family protein [Candidatus Binataceae bacterium]|nr:polyprenyl synthetase family protein [Candidatus Binataceae bacterium]